MATMQDAAKKFVEADIAREEAEKQLIHIMAAENCDACIITSHLIEKDGSGGIDDAFLTRSQAPVRLG